METVKDAAVIIEHLLVGGVIRAASGKFVGAPKVADGEILANLLALRIVRFVPGMLGSLQIAPDRKQAVERLHHLYIRLDADKAGWQWNTVEYFGYTSLMAVRETVGADAVMTVSSRFFYLVDTLMVEVKVHGSKHVVTKQIRRPITSTQAWDMWAE